MCGRTLALYMLPTLCTLKYARAFEFRFARFARNWTGKLALSQQGVCEGTGLPSGRKCPTNCETCRICTGTAN